MTLSCRPDWPEAAERLARWWEGDYLGRPAMAITAPRDDAPRFDVPEAPDLWRHWTDPEFVVPRVEAGIRRTAWLGEACPQTWVNLGPVSMAGYLGTGIHVMPYTVWQSAIVDDWETYEVRFDPENEWWRITRRLAEALVETGAGHWFVANADLGEPADVMSYLRGPQRLCLDLVEGPREKMARVRDDLAELLWFFYEELTAIVSARMEGTSSWLGVWSPKRTSTLQCDFSCMISSALFDEFIAPALAELTRRLDHVIYHLDGAGALHHVDTLLALPRLHAIQWVPGSGDDGPAHPRWRPLLKKIIAAGKRVHISVAAGEVEGLLRDLPADALYIATSCRSEEEGRELLANAEKWSRAGV